MRTFKDEQKDIERKFELLYQKHRKIIQENARVKKDFIELRQKYDQLLDAMVQAKSDIKSLLAYIQEGT